MMDLKSSECMRVSSLFDWILWHTRWTRNNVYQNVFHVMIQATIAWRQAGMLTFKDNKGDPHDVEKKG